MLDEATKVLLIEDDTEDYVLIRNLLRESGSVRFDLTRAEGFEQALDAVRQNDYDVCLIDYRLGDKNGIELIQEMDLRGGRVPAILLAGQYDPDVDDRATQAGAVDYLVKGQISRPLLERSIRSAVERANALKALRESENKYRTIVETAREGIWIVDADAKTTYVNQSLTEMLGYTEQELLGRYAFDIVDAGCRREAEENFEQRRLGVAGKHEYCLRRKDGSLMWAIISTNPLYDTAGRFQGSIGMVTDITEHKNIEERIHEADQRALREYEHLLDRLASLAQSFGTARDLKTIFRALREFSLAFTPSFAQVVCLYDAARSERKGVYFFANGREYDPSDVRPIPVRNGATSRAIKTGEIITCNDYQKDLCGRKQVGIGFEEDEKIPLSALIAPLTIMGRTIGTIEVQSHQLNAYTKEHETAMRMAANLAATAIENVRLIEQERQSAEQLQQSQKMEAVGRLAGGVAHDFNNLLTAITGYSDLTLRRLEQGNPFRRNIEEIKKAGDRAASLTRQLLAFSRKQVLQPKVLNLNDVVSDMDKMLHRLIGEDIELLSILDPALGYIQADPGQIEQVLMNLVVNSRDAMPKGGKLTIETRNIQLDEEYAARHVSVAPGSYVMLVVSDTGCGISEETQAYIFEPFFTTKELGKGTGLGLSTVYGIVKQSGGNIWVYSEKGQGTTFKVYLPRVGHVSQDIRAEPVNGPLPQGTETVLVVEDEEVVRRMARRILEMNGYHVLDASRADEAIEICKHYMKPIHLLLTDVVMPQMGGRDLAERIIQLRPQTKVLYMSGYTDDAIVHHGVLDPDVAFLQKPFVSATLTHKVREVLDSPSEEINGTPSRSKLLRES